MVNGFLTWVGGNWNGASSVTIPATSKLLLVGTGDLDMSGCVLTNYGTVEWTSGTIRGGGGIYNYGLWDAQSDQTLANTFQSFTFDNFGTFRKSGGIKAGSTLLTGGVLFNLPSGVLDVQQGNLVLQGSGNFTGGYITTNSTGTTVFSIGNFSLNGTPTGTNVIENSGNLVGTVVVNGFLTWVGGNWNGASSVTIPATSKLLLVGTGDLDMSGCVLTNYGTVAWTSGMIRGGGGIYNYGLWDAQSDQTLANTFQSFTFDNFGTFRKSGGTNTSQTLLTGGVLFNLPSGVLDVQQGNLVLQGSGNFTGGYITTNSTGTTVFSIGNFSLNGTPTGTNVIENSGNLVGTVVVNGFLTWVGGNWNGASSVTIPATSKLLLIGPGNLDMSGCVLTNYGTVAWTSGMIRGGGGIYNYGLWDAQSDQTLASTFQSFTFDNFGTFRKSGGIKAGSTLLTGGVLFNLPSGVLDVQQGNLVLQGSGNFTGGYITTNSTGTTVFSVGNFNLNGTPTGTNVIENSGNLVGTNVINGALAWVGGNWNGTVVTIFSNSIVNLIGPGNLDMSGGVLTNYGKLAWTSGMIRGGGGIYNYGLWDAQSDQTLASTFQSFTFDNFGTFRKSGGIKAGSTLLTGGVLFNLPSGVLDVQQGNLVLQGSGNFTGGYITTNSTGTTVFSVGNFNLNGTPTGTNVIENSGNLVGTNVINGALAWVGGNWNGTVVTIFSNSIVNLIGPGNLDMSGGVLTNYGKLAWTSGMIRGGGGIYNYGLWDAQSDQTLASTFQSFTFDNFGTFRKSGGTNTSQTLLTGGVNFINPGTLDVQTGIISLLGTYSLTNGTLNIDLSSLTNFGRLNFGGSATVAGLLSVNLVGNFEPAVGSKFQIVSSTGQSGTFNSVDIPAGISVIYTNSGVFLDVTGLVPVQIFNTKLSGNNLQFQFDTVSGQSYTIEWNDDLTTNNWAFYTNFTGNGVVFQFQVPVMTNPPQNFYRVREP